MDIQRHIQTLLHVPETQSALVHHIFHSKAQM